MTPTFTAHDRKSMMLGCIIGVVLVSLYALIFGAGCGGKAEIQAVTIAARKVTNGYKVLNTVDEQRQNKIRASSEINALKARELLRIHLARHALFKQALDRCSEVLEEAVKSGWGKALLAVLQTAVGELDKVQKQFEEALP